MELGDEIARLRVTIEWCKKFNITHAMVNKMYKLAWALKENGDKVAAYNKINETINIADGVAHDIPPDWLNFAAHIALVYGDLVLALHYFERIIDPMRRKPHTKPDIGVMLNIVICHLARSRFSIAHEIVNRYMNDYIDPHLTTYFKQMRDLIDAVEERDIETCEVILELFDFTWSTFDLNDRLFYDIKKTLLREVAE